MVVSDNREEFVELQILSPEQAEQGECCVCLNFHWGVKLPNCSHYICPKCYYRIYNGYISCDFHSENLKEFSNGIYIPLKYSNFLHLNPYE